MKHKFLFGALVALWPMNLLAGLQANINSTPGTSCYSEMPSMRVTLCGPAEMYGDDFSYFEGDCPSTYQELIDDGRTTCYFGISGGYVVMCDYVDASSPVCGYCGVPSTGDVISDWTNVGSNRVRQTIIANASVAGDDIAIESGYTCTMDYSEEYKYGCAAGYYQSSGTGASMTCTACESSGTNSVGSTAITSCYMPSGSSFSDTTGAGTYTGNCYYTN